MNVWLIYCGAVVIATLAHLIWHLGWNRGYDEGQRK